MLTTLLPLRIILPSLRLVSSLVSSTSSSTRFIYSSYPNSLPSICLPSFRRRSNFWFTAFSRTSNGKDMAEGKENTLFKTIPYLLKKNKFYRDARFYPVNQVINWLKKVGFNKFETVQTVFKNLGKIQSLEPVEEGFGKGLFVVISAEVIK